MTTRAFLLLALTLLLPACASAESRERAAPAPDVNGNVAYQTSTLKGRDAPPLDRMLVKRARLEIEADDMAEVLAAAQRIAKANDGYVSSTATSDERRIGITLRVSVDKLDAALDALAALGSVEGRSVSAEDVTEQVIDLDARQKNLSALRDRLRKLLEKAATVQDVVAVEKELVTVQGDLDSLEARLKQLRSTASLSEISLTAERPRILGPLGYLGYGLWWGFSKLFLIR